MFLEALPKYLFEKAYGLYDSRNILDNQLE